MNFGLIRTSHDIAPARARQVGAEKGVERASQEWEDVPRDAPRMRDPSVAVLPGDDHPERMVKSVPIGKECNPLFSWSYGEFGFHVCTDWNYRDRHLACLRFVECRHLSTLTLAQCAGKIKSPYVWTFEIGSMGTRREGVKHKTGVP